MSWLSRIGVRPLLASADIPAPSMLMAHMVALRIAQLPSEHAFDDRKMHLRIPIRDSEREIEIWVQAEAGAMYWTNNRQYATVRLGMPGPPVYRSVDLTREESLVIIDAAHALHLRTIERRYAERQAESQHNALDILEHLL